MMVFKAFLAISIEVGLLYVQVQNVIKKHHAN
jgi:hypothetical protein